MYDIVIAVLFHLRHFCVTMTTGQLIVVFGALRHLEYNLCHDLDVFV